MEGAPKKPTAVCFGVTGFFWRLPLACPWDPAMFKFSGAAAKRSAGIGSGRMRPLGAPSSPPAEGSAGPAGLQGPGSPLCFPGKKPAAVGQTVPKMEPW